jgi:hypothetical protein
MMLTKIVTEPSLATQNVSRFMHEARDAQLGESVIE